MPRWMAHWLVTHITRLVNLPNVDTLLWLGTQSRQKLVILGAESHRYILFVRFNFKRADNLALFKRFGICLAFFIARSVIIYSIDGDDRGLVAFLSHGERPPILTDGHSCDAFSALDARVSLLRFVFQMVDHDVVTSRVHNLVVIQEEDVVRHIRLQTRDELGRQGDLRIFNSLLGCCTAGISLRLTCWAFGLLHRVLYIGHFHD